MQTTDLKLIRSDSNNSEIKGTLEIGRFLVPFRIYGKNDKTLMLINGAQQSMGMWRPVIPVFKDEYRIVIFDFPGQGRAKICSGSTIVTFEEQIDVLYEVVIATGSHKELTLMSASWGSIIIASFAERYPQMVKKMVLGSFGVKPNDYLKELMKETKEHIDKGEIIELPEMIINGFGGKIPESMKQAIRYQFKNMNKKHFETLKEHILFVENIEDVTKVINPERITAKTLLLNGEDHTIVDAEDNREFVEKMSNCEWKIVKNTGHFMVFENYKVFDIIKDFLNG